MQAMPVQSIGVKAWMIRIICIACYPTTSPIPCAKCAVEMIQTILPLQLHKDTLLLQHTKQNVDKMCKSHLFSRLQTTYLLERMK